MAAFNMAVTNSLQANQGPAGKPAQKVTAADVKKINAFINLVPANVGADNGPENLYGAVMLNGKVIAAVYRTGCTGMPEDIGQQLKGLMEENQTNPDLAEKRLALIAQAVGGTVVKAPLPDGNESATAPELGFTMTFEADKAKTQAEWSSSFFDAQFMGQGKRNDAS